MKINANNMPYNELNRKIRESEEKEFQLININGQRYICAGIEKPMYVKINGVPGNDLGCFMDGPIIYVDTNAQDGVGNTMNSGKIVVNGNAGDVLGYGMMGGKIFVKGNVGYRVGIHIKAFKDHAPVIVIGGSAGDFLGEYMAGGTIIVLGLKGEPVVGSYVGTGMHGGTIFIHGEAKDHQLGKEVGVDTLTLQDKSFLKDILTEYCHDLDVSNDLMKDGFTKIIPKSNRPYEKLYCY